MCGTTTSVWILVLAVLFSLLLPVPSWALDVVQSDWSGGDGEAGPASAWDLTFETCIDISWRSLPGQLALASDPLLSPARHILATGLPVAFGIHPVDIDQDGDMDVIGGAGEAQVIALWLNDGQAPPGWSLQLVDSTFAGAAGVHAADVDGDHDPDILASAETPGNKLAWWRNDGGSPIAWSRQLLDDAFPVSCSIMSTDINQDGRPDVLATSWSLGDVAWWRNDGGTPVTWTKQIVDPSFGGAHDALAVDLDEDGDLDMVGAAGALHQVAWWRNNGGNPIAWQRYPIQTGFSGARAVHVADIDRDGRPDVVAVAWQNHVTWWRNEGGDPLSWTRFDVDTNWSGGHSVWTGDVDGDGWVDILATAYNANKVSWWHNSGTQPIIWTEHPLATDWTNPMNVRAGDLDGNGDLEILATSRQLGEFAYWEATSFRSAGTLQGSVLDLGVAPDTSWLGWTLRQPASTGLLLRVRSSDDAGDLGPWSGPVLQPGALPVDLGRYFQYRLELSTSDPEVSPLFEEIRFFGASPAGVNEGSADGHGLSMKTVWCSNEGTVVRVSVPQSCHVLIGIFDLSGRRVRTIADRFFAAGEHEVAVRGLPSGIYLCRMEAQGTVLKGRLTVLH